MPIRDPNLAMFSLTLTLESLPNEILDPGFGGLVLRHLRPDHRRHAVPDLLGTGGLFSATSARRVDLWSVVGLAALCGGRVLVQHRRERTDPEGCRVEHAGGYASGCSGNYSEA